MKWFNNSKNKNNKTDHNDTDAPVIVSKDTMPMNDTGHVNEDNSSVINPKQKDDDSVITTNDHDDNASDHNDDTGHNEEQALASNDTSKQEHVDNTVDSSAGTSSMNKTEAPQSDGPQPITTDDGAVIRAMERTHRLRNVILSFFLFAGVILISSVNFTQVFSVGAASASDDLQSDVSMITEAISKKAMAHQEAVVTVLDKTERPSDAQLEKLGGWKLSWRQYVKNGRLYGEVKNVNGPNGKEQVVWSGKLKSAKTVKISVDASVINVKNGTITDNLTTYSYAVIGRIPPTAKQLREARTDYEKKIIESNAKSIIMFTSGDDDTRAAMMKAQGDGRSSWSVNSNQSSGFTWKDGYRPRYSRL